MGIATTTGIIDAGKAAAAMATVVEGGQFVRLETACVKNLPPTDITKLTPDHVDQTLVLLFVLVRCSTPERLTKTKYPPAKLVIFPTKV